MSTQLYDLPGTIVWLAPFWNRSGYGCASRTFVAALHDAGARIRVLPVNEIELGINDCDLGLIRRLETTPIVPPVTYIVSHVPSKSWLEAVKLPEPNIRIMTTTFEGSAQGNAPPAEWLSVFSELDQVWLLTETERQVFINAGVPPEKVQVVYWPNPWLNNPVLDPPNLKPSAPRFRFLSVAMFQPRRRWDTLIEAYLEEFKGNDGVELFFKVNYPSWHPQPGKPRRDLLGLVENLRQKTGSDAAITINDDLGRRMDIVKLMDSCSAYISTDTCPTAPISEAWARQRMIIMADGLGYFQTTSGNELPTEPYIGIAVDPDARYELTKDMLMYQPHHKDTFMPKLHVKDVRTAMRRAYDMPASERTVKMSNGPSFLMSPEAVTEGAIRAIHAGWKYRKESKGASEPISASTRIVWEGPLFSHDSHASINRELCQRLSAPLHEVSIVASDKPGAKNDEDFRQKISGLLHRQLSGAADIHVRNGWPPVFAPPQQGRWVMMQSWPYGKIPADWVKPITSMVDEIWAPNAHVRQTFISSAIPAERVFTIPAGIDVKRFHPIPRPVPEPGRKFRFLFVGRLVWEKGIDVLLSAYRRAFTRRDDVVLIVKDSRRGPSDPEILKIIGDIKNDSGGPAIIHYSDWLSPEQMTGMYNSCDCLVHPYRAEGFGVSVLEAMACGVPVIATAGGATDDFCKPGGAYLIPAQTVSFNMPKLRLAGAGGAGWVLEPDIDSLSHLLRQVRQESGAARERGSAGSEYVRSHYAWEEIAEAVEARIRILGAQPVLRY